MKRKARRQTSKAAEIRIVIQLSSKAFLTFPEFDQNLECIHMDKIVCSCLKFIANILL